MKFVWGAIKHYMRVTDRWLILMWLGASGLSIVFLLGIHNTGYLASMRTVAMQAGAVGIGFLATVIISKIDYNMLLKLWKLYLPVCLILMVLTFTSLGIVRGGDKAWLPMPFGGGTLQPSEFLKISFITTFALHLNKVKEHLNRPLTILLLCLHGGAHVLLVQLQGDGGTALIFVMIFLVMIFCAGINWKYIAAAVASCAAILPLLWFKIMTDDQKMRFLIILNPELDKDYAWQQLQGSIALGTGGIGGNGIFSGRHVYVPEIYNDFIFTFIGESSGFIGCMGVVLLLTAICLKILYNSSVAKDTVGRFLCIGVFAMILSQMCINLGMCLSLLPVIGVTLPLFSSGGSSVLALYCGLGLVLSVYNHSQQALFYGEGK